MSRIIVSTVFDTAKTLATKSGQDLRDFITYSVQSFEVVIRNLRNSLTFEDNVLCDVKHASLQHNVSSVIYTGGKQPKHVLFTRVISASTLIDATGWYLDDSGNTVVRVKFSPTPPVSETFDVSLILLY